MTDKRWPSDWKDAKGYSAPAIYSQTLDRASHVDVYIPRTDADDPNTPDIDGLLLRLNTWPLMYEALRSIENDDGTIPATIWEMRNAALAAAEGGTRRERVAKRR